MKCLSLGGSDLSIWFERIQSSFSAEETTALHDVRECNENNRRLIWDDFQNRSIKIASLEDASIAQEVYEKNRIENSELIAVNIILPSLHGSINCKIGNEYKNIRF